MSSIVPQLDFDDLGLEQLAQSHRTPRAISWQQGMLAGGISLLNKNTMKYCYGDSDSPVWDNSVTYNLNQYSLTLDGNWISTVNENINNHPGKTPIYSNTELYDIGTSVSYGFTVINGISTPTYYICNTTIYVAENFNPSKWTLISGPVWYQIAPYYIGANERIQYSAQKLTMEYALNRFFRKEFRNPTSFNDGTTSGQWYLPLSDIWIQTTNFTYASFGVCSIGQIEGGVKSLPTIFGVCSSSITLSSTTYQYIVWIPTSLSISLGSSYIQIISFIVDKMSLLGTSYQIQLY